MFKNQFKPARTGFHRVASLKNLTTEELVSRFSDWLVCQRYSRVTFGVYNRVVKQFFQFWGGRKLSSVTHHDIRAFLIELSTRDLSADILHRYIWALRCFFDFLCMGGLVDESAPRLIRPRPVLHPLPRVLSAQNVRKLIRAASSTRNRAIFELFYATGCRVSELVNIRMEDVDFAARTIRIRGKGKDRRVLFGTTAKKALLAYLGGRQTGFLFQNQPRVQVGCVSWNGSCWGGYWFDYTDPTGHPRNRCVALGPKSMTRAEAWRKFKKLVPNPDKGHARKSMPLTRSGHSRHV